MSVLRILVGTAMISFGLLILSIDVGLLHARAREAMESGSELEGGDLQGFLAGLTLLTVGLGILTG